MTPMLDLEDAQRQVIAMAHPLAEQSVAIEQAAGLYLARPVSALRTQPEHPLSAMDGWAVRGADMPGPWRIIGESAAGHAFAGTVGCNEAVRISTGAMVPGGADVVLVQEDCVQDGDGLRFDGTAPEPPGRHIRARGLDFCEGSALLPQGVRLNPAALALAIGGGHGTVRVHKPPRVAILDCGDELRAPGLSLRAGDLPASNGPMLAAMCAEQPCEITRAGPIGDDRDAIVAAFESVKDADIVITSGGASVGDHDLIRPALAAIGADIAFWRVAMKPGKPIMVARRGHQIILGLPGNPVSCFVTAFLFALPLVKAMNGSAQPLPMAETAVLQGMLGPTSRRAEFLRAVRTDNCVEPVRAQDSGAILPLALANALIIRAPNSGMVRNGDNVPIFRLYG